MRTAWPHALVALSLLATGCPQGATELSALKSEVAALRSDVRNLTSREAPSLARFLALSSDPEARPRTAEEATRMRSEFAKFLHTLSAEEEAVLLPDLRRARWSVQAVWMLRTLAEAPVASVRSAALPQLTELLHDDASSSGDLRNELIATRRRLLKELLASEASLGPDEMLGYLETDPEDSDLQAAFVRALEESINLHAKQVCATASDRLGKLKDVQDHEVVRSGLLQLHEQLLTEWHAVLDHGSDASVIGDLRRAMAAVKAALDQEVAREREVERQRLVEYQRWALRRVKLFEEEYGGETIKGRVKSALDAFKSPKEPFAWDVLRSGSALGIVQSWIATTPVLDGTLSVEQQSEIYKHFHTTAIGWRGKDTDLACAVLRDGLLRILGPIDPKFLEAPVATLYQRAYQTGWNYLEGREDQTWVAQEWVMVRRLSPGESLPDAN